jgi:glycogen(starch) synthase
MRILFISNFYPPHGLGGLELRCGEVVEELIVRGHVCRVLTSRYGVRGRPTHAKGITRVLYPQTDVYYYRPLDFFLRRPWQELANRRALRSALDTFQPDVVFIWGMWNLSPRVAYWAEQWVPGRVAYSFGDYWPLGTDPHTAYWSQPSQSRLARVLLRPIALIALGILKAERFPPRLQFRHASCCSQYLVDALAGAGVVPPGAVAILNGIDPAPFVAQARPARAPGAPLRFLYFGGLMEHKGVHTAIEALGLLEERGRAGGLHLTIVGGGHPDYEAHLRALTRSLSLEDKVHFGGRVHRSEIPKILSNHDVFLFTSIWAEPFGRTIIEAMAAGLAVIGADVGGNKEILRLYPEDMLFAAGDAAALALKMEHIIDDPDLVQRLGQAGQELVLEHFTLNRMVNETEAWLEEIAGHGCSRFRRGGPEVRA